MANKKKKNTRNGKLDASVNDTLRTINGFVSSKPLDGTCRIFLNTVAQRK